MSFLEKTTQSPLDVFLADSIDKHLKAILGYSEHRKVKKKISDQFSLSIDSPVKDIKKLFSTLQDIYGKDSEKLIQQLLANVVSLRKEKKELWLEIHDEGLKSLFLSSFGDPFKKNILDVANVKEHVSMDMLSTTKVPQASGYRRIKELVESGLLIETSVYSPERGRKAPRYMSLIDKVQINIEEGFKTSLKIKIADEFMRNSAILNLL